MSNTTSSTGLEVLLSTLQNAGDVESTLNILNVLDELLSAGTDRRIHYMISKGGSEALLTALVKTARCFTPNYTILMPLLHLLAKVGHRDQRIGQKAERAEAVLLTLSLLRQNEEHAHRAAACLWTIQVFCSSVSTANLIGENRGLDVVYHLISPFATKNLSTTKAAADALTGLLCTKANVTLAVLKGYVTGLLRLYEDWHSNDTEHVAIAIRRALLRCLHQVTHSSAGRKTVVSHGLKLLYESTQACMRTRGLESLVELSVQLMRKCYPKAALPLTSDLSVYLFSLPGGRDTKLNTGVGSDETGEEESDGEDMEDIQETDNKDYDDDLETDLNTLRARPEPDRPKELLSQYSQLCPELTHHFQELESGSEPERSASSSSSSSDDDLQNGSPCSSQRNGTGSADYPALFLSSSLLDSSRKATQEPSREPQPEPCDLNSSRRPVSTHKGRSESTEERREEDQEKSDEDLHHRSVVDHLLERHGVRIPFHDPKLYRAAAAQTRSIPGFSILAFPDFWGHLPPLGCEPMAPRKPKIQRQKVLDDIWRLLCADDIINQVVFDLEDNSCQGASDSLRFFSKFESGNLRKAIQVRRYEYDLMLNADANCSQHTQWFYFEVSNMVPNVPYRFNVINCEKTNSQFNYGMQPVLYSVREALAGNPCWVRTGSEICYYRNHFCPARSNKKPSFYTLTFTVTFKHNEDVCYLAYHYPYTFSALQSHLQALQRSLDSTKVFFRQQTLCDSLAGNICPLITITACPVSNSWRDMHQLRNRRCIVLTARVHPGESNASWVMKGTLEFLCGDDLVAQSLREAFVFKIIPMLNPDGVINGTHRCSLSGSDLNRQWSRPDPLLSPTIYHSKGLLYHLCNTGHTPLVFCDYHGHSRKKNVFLYGCSVKETLWQSGSAVDTVGLKEDPGYRTIPKTLDRIAPAFSFNSCNYLVEKSRSATARVVVWREIGVLRSYTMESTYNGCDQGIYKGLQTGTRELEEMGVKLCQSLLSLRTDSVCSRKLISHMELEHSILDHKSHNCFEDDEPPCAEEIEYSVDCCPKLSATEMDSDVNGDTFGADEQQDEAGRAAGSNKHPNRKSQLIPQRIGRGSIDTLSMTRRSCQSVSIANGHYLS